jgi:hypothetical protein
MALVEGLQDFHEKQTLGSGALRWPTFAEGGDQICLDGGDQDLGGALIRAGTPAVVEREELVRVSVPVNHSQGSQLGAIDLESSLLGV